MSQNNESIKFDLSDEDIKSISIKTANLKGFKIAKLSPDEMQQIMGGMPGGGRPGLPALF